jgi:hypothetical protein
MNQWQREITSVKIRESLARIERETGRRNGNRPYGSKPNEDVAAVVEAFRAAGSYDGAARRLNVQGVPCRVRGAVWSGSVVRDIVKRAAPEEVMPTSSRTTAPAGRGRFRLSQLVACSTCGHLLTGSTGRLGDVRYQCPRSRTVPHARGWVSETKLMPVVAAEAERAAVRWRRLQVGSREDDARLRDLEGKRRRVLENYDDGHYDRPTRDAKLAEIAEQESKLTAVRWIRRVTLPPDLTTGDPSRVNAWLRRLLVRATVDMSQPARRGPSAWTPTMTFEWRDPSMRTDGPDDLEAAG